MSRYRTFKGTERTIARRLGGTRTGHLGGQDVDAGWLSCEVKHRKQLPAWLTDAMSQARRHAAAEQLPVVILHQHGGRHDDNLIVLRLQDFQEWFGDMGKWRQVCTPDKQ